MFKNITITLISLFVFAHNSYAQEKVQYKLTFKANWSKTSHPTGFPSKPHFSGLIGATHNEDGHLWTHNELASEGIKQMAETGSKRALTKEIKNIIRKKSAKNLLSGGSISISPGQRELTFTVERDFSLVSLVSMLAPSPDWFVGVSGIKLYKDGKWVHKVAIKLDLYDAGTDDGVSFKSSNNKTRPLRPISKLTSHASDTDFTDGKKTVGVFIFEKI